MRKEIEINGCIEIPPEMTVDGYYMNPDGTRGKFVLDD